MVILIIWGSPTYLHHPIMYATVRGVNTGQILVGTFFTTWPQGRPHGFSKGNIYCPQYIKNIKQMCHEFPHILLTIRIAVGAMLWVLFLKHKAMRAGGTIFLFSFWRFLKDFKQLATFDQNIGGDIWCYVHTSLNIGGDIWYVHTSLNIGGDMSPCPQWGLRHWLRSWGLSRTQSNDYTVGFYTSV